MEHKMIARRIAAFVTLLTFGILAAVTLVALSCAPVKADPINELLKREEFKTTVTKAKDALTLWDISSVTSDTHHYGCEARRDMGMGVILTVRLPSDPKASSMDITLSGVNFGLAGSQYGLWQVDDEDPVDIFGNAVTAWTTGMQVSTEFSKAETLKQFAGGRKLRLMFNNHFFELDLKETSAMLRELRKCNDVGQKMLNRKRMDAAVKAPTRNKNA